MNDTDARLWHPWLRINRVLRVVLNTRWSAEAWPQVKAERCGVRFGARGGSTESHRSTWRPTLENRLARYLAVTVTTIVLTSGCSGTAPGAPKTDGPRYQMQVIGEQANIYVYRLDTATGEIETFLVTSPQVVQRLSPEAAKMLSDLHGSLTFTPGPTLAGKRK